MKKIFLLIIFLLVSWIIIESLNNNGIKDLKGEFQQIAFLRNENNTGPIIRIYSVVVSDTAWSELEKYGHFMPHTKYGNTKVFFFLQDTPAPQQLFFGNENFDGTFKRYCIAKYEKDGNGQVFFVKNPY
jgi:hypothetical protein